MQPFWIASDVSVLMGSNMRCGSSLGKRLLRLAAILPVLIALTAVSSRPSAAQACTNCKIPSGYTTSKQDPSQLCFNQDVVCTCGGVKSAQPMCLYKVIPGGGTHHSVLTPKLPANK